MKRGLLAAFLCVAVWLGAAGRASAQDMGFEKTGGFGVGGSLTNRGVSGASVYFVPAAKIGIQGVLHFDSTSSDGNSESLFGLTVNGLYSLIADGAFALPAFVGFDFTRTSSDDGTTTTSDTGIALQLGVQPAWWPTPAVSLHLSLALLIDLNSNGGSGGSVGDGTEIAFPGTPEFVGAAGVTFWIK